MLEKDWVSFTLMLHLFGIGEQTKLNNANKWETIPHIVACCLLFREKREKMKERVRIEEV